MIIIVMIIVILNNNDYSSDNKVDSNYSSNNNLIYYFKKIKIFPLSPIFLFPSVLNNLCKGSMVHYVKVHNLDEIVLPAANKASIEQYEEVIFFPFCICIF